jgi:hypothetical protein
MVTDRHRQHRRQGFTYALRALALPHSVRPPPGNSSPPARATADAMPHCRPMPACRHCSCNANKTTISVGQPGLGRLTHLSPCGTKGSPALGNRRVQDCRASSPRRRCMVRPNSKQDRHTHSRGRRNPRSTNQTGLLPIAVPAPDRSQPTATILTSGTTILD